MTPEQMNIAIAEACGIASHDHIGPIFKTQSGFVRDCPDYCADLNAMHEAEKVLTESKRRCYFFRLFATQRLDDSDLWKAVHATAAQRAEAFCRTAPSKQDPKLTIWAYHERSKQ